MRKALLLILAVLLLEHIPYRLIAVSSMVVCQHPSYSELPQSNDDYWKVKDLAAKLDGMGWDVQFASIIGAGVYGLTDPASHVIQIEQSLSWDARYMVLTHEAGHTLQPGWYGNGPEGEIFAESVSTMLSGHLWEHARYLSRFKFQYFTQIAFDWPKIVSTARYLRS